MKPKDFYELLADLEEDAEMSLSPGPVIMKVSKHDGTAARLILWLETQMLEDATIGDLLDVLDAARWWVVLWSSLSTKAIDRHKEEYEEYKRNFDEVFPEPELELMEFDDWLQATDRVKASPD